MACKRRPWVGSSTPNLALVGERGSVQESPKCQNLPKTVAFGQRKPTDEIRRVNVDHVCEMHACQICICVDMVREFAHRMLSVLQRLGDAYGF